MHFHSLAYSKESLNYPTYLVYEVFAYNQVGLDLDEEDERPLIFVVGSGDFLPFSVNICQHDSIRVSLRVLFKPLTNVVLHC